MKIIKKALTFSILTLMASCGYEYEKVTTQGYIENSRDDTHVDTDNNCYLNNPVYIGDRNLLESKLEFENVVLNELPKFLSPEKFDHIRNELFISLFNIEYNGIDLDMFGLNIGYERPDFFGDSVGFVGAYKGSFDIGGYMVGGRGPVTYVTTEERVHEEEWHAKNTAETKLKLTVEDEKIIAVELVVPVYKVWKLTEDGSRITQFTGEHQTLCVKEMTLKDN